MHFLGRGEGETPGPNAGDGAGLILACREGNYLRPKDFSNRVGTRESGVYLFRQTNKSKSRIRGVEDLTIQMFDAGPVVYDTLVIVLQGAQHRE